MDQNLAEIFGLIAASCTTVSFIPQAIKVYQTKHTKDISLSMFVIFVLGLAFWIVYGFWGFSAWNYPIILCNGLTMVFAGYILIQKIRLG